VEEDMVVKLGPLVAVVVVEAAVCCLLPACPRVQGMRAQIAAYAWGGGPYVVAHPTGPLELAIGEEHDNFHESISKHFDLLFV